MSKTETTVQPPIKMDHACSWEQEMDCRADTHWDDGVPYCDKCGLYRKSIHIRDKRRGR